jgi:neutral trehalase
VEEEVGVSAVVQHTHAHHLPVLALPPPLIPHSFVESYYWDTYWCILGLLRSGMHATATGMLLNLVYLADTFGFVPNGGRVYYVLPGRSQPPLLSSMVRTLYAATGNASLVAHSYGALRREYTWWMGSGEYGHAVTIEEAEPEGAAAERDGGGGADDGGGGNASLPAAGRPQGRRRQGHTHILNRFVTDQHIPRPGACCGGSGGLEWLGVV